jgi:hypothetical protein
MLIIRKNMKKTKKTTVKKTPKKKPVKNTAKKTNKKGPRPYKKCIQLVIKMAEDFADFGDCSDDILDEIAKLKQQLDKKEQTVVSSLASGVFNPRVIEIDEASPGSDLQFKI